jgi:hypothetical protein
VVDLSNKSQEFQDAYHRVIPDQSAPAKARRMACVDIPHTDALLAVQTAIIQIDT